MKTMEKQRIHVRNEQELLGGAVRIGFAKDCIFNGIGGASEAIFLY